MKYFLVPAVQASGVNGYDDGDASQAMLNNEVFPGGWHARPHCTATDISIQRKMTPVRDLMPRMPLTRQK